MHSEDVDSISPFLLMDHAAPRYFPPTQQKLGVGEHPHRGFETVTFAIKGEVEHRDSGGGGGTITTGGIQWMTAGSGVVHDEFHSREFSEKGGDFEMIQLWVNLTSKFKMTPPRYQSFAAINIYEINGPSQSQLEFPLPVGSNTLVFQLSGNSTLGNQTIDKGNLAILGRSGDSLNLELNEESKVMILNGEPLGEPVAAYGPFVMNTRQELMDAFKDFQEGKMGQLVDQPERV